MKFYLYFTLAFLFAPLFMSGQMKIKVKVDQYEGDTLYLGYYYGKGKYFYDTALVNNDKAIFEKDTLAPKGLYLLFDPVSGKYVDLILGDDQKFTLNTTADFNYTDITFDGAKENSDFYNYIKTVSSLRPKADSILKLPKDDPAYAELEEMNLRIRGLQRELVSTYPNSIAGSFIKSNMEIEIPEFEGTDQEVRLKKYYYYKDHYFDNINLKDDNLIRTNFFFPKIEQYVDKVVAQHPDSISKGLDSILIPMRDHAPESFKYFLVHYLNKYAKSKLVGMDAVYVHLVNEYYAKGYADWVPKEKLEGIIEEAAKLEPTLVGKKAPEITIKNLKTDTKFSLYDIESDYTILYFWDPDCGHCKKATPKVIEFYKDFRDSGIVLVAICTEVNTEARTNCLEYIDKKEDMDIFTNAYDPYLRSRYKQKYDIRSTPKVYILDADKKILTKNIGAEQLKDVMSRLLKLGRNELKSGS